MLNVFCSASDLAYYYSKCSFLVAKNLSAKLTIGSSLVTVFTANDQQMSYKQHDYK